MHATGDAGSRLAFRRLTLGAVAVAAALAAAGHALASAGTSGIEHAAPRTSVPGASPRLAGCQILPSDNPFNQPVNQLPVAADSQQILARIGLDAHVHADFGTVYDGAPNGIPINVVSSRTRRVPVRFQYASESDGHFYPIPRHVAIEGGARSNGDRHVILLDRSTCTDYELYAARPHDHTRRWTAGSGAIFNLRSDHLRPAGWTSADAAGLPILPGLARYSEVAAGAIDHALRFTSPCTGPRYVYPARHEAASCSGPYAPPMGLRVRLKASVDTSSLPYQARVVAAALKRYGLILADNGSPWYISGAPDRHWNNDALHELARLSGSDFEVVDTSSLPHPGL
jgi:hypothetical protein